MDSITDAEFSSQLYVVSCTMVEIGFFMILLQICNSNTREKQLPADFFDGFVDQNFFKHLE